MSNIKRELDDLTMQNANLTTRIDSLIEQKQEMAEILGEFQHKCRDPTVDEWREIVKKACNVMPKYIRAKAQNDITEQVIKRAKEIGERVNPRPFIHILLLSSLFLDFTGPKKNCSI